MKNSVQLIGNLGIDPEIKKLANGRTMARFTMATSEYYRNQDGERVENTQWHQVVAWGKTAEIVEKYLKKGQEVGVEGRLNSRSYMKDGDKKYITEVVVNELVMLGKAAKQPAQSA